MATGKYSPTINFSYTKDWSWFEKNGGDFGNGLNPNSEYDDDGYDSYGYNANGVDRAGHTVESYTYNPDLYDKVMYSDDWSICIIDKKHLAEDLNVDPIYQKELQKKAELEKLISDAQQLLIEVNLSLSEIVRHKKSEF